MVPFAHLGGQDIIPDMGGTCFNVVLFGWQILFLQVDPFAHLGGHETVGFTDNGFPDGGFRDTRFAETAFTLFGRHILFLQVVPFLHLGGQISYLIDIFGCEIGG